MPALLNIEIPVYSSLQLAIFQRKTWKVTGPCCQICCIGAHTRIIRPLHYHQTVNRKPSKTMNWLKIVRSQYPHWNIKGGTGSTNSQNGTSEYEKWLWKVAMKMVMIPLDSQLPVYLQRVVTPIFWNFYSSIFFSSGYGKSMKIMIDCWIAWRDCL